jgi:L-histidine Nalpha-methyltransferase
MRTRDTDRNDMATRLHSGDRFVLVVDDGETGHREDFARDVRAGLTAVPKSLPCRYFYDREGSHLFEQICDLPEYYLPRAEREILRAHSGDVASRFATRITMVELGSGNAEKTRILIEAFLRRHEALRYVPVDISRGMLEDSARAVHDAYPGLEVLAVAGDYLDGLRYLGTGGGDPKLILWLGSSIGNLERPEAAAFLRRVGGAMSARDRLLVGIDLRKERSVLEPAYDDSQGVTARFNLNILARINRELGGQFDLETFRHRAVYDAEIGRIEMYLVSTGAQQVRIDRLGLTVGFDAGEAIHTENSYKYSVAEIDALAGDGGLRLDAQWLDSGGRFSVNVFACGAGDDGRRT